MNQLIHCLPWLCLGRALSLVRRMAVIVTLLIVGVLAAAPAGAEQATPEADDEVGLVMNFRDAPLQTVLEFLSEEAGLAVVNGVELEERVTVFSRQPLTLDQAVALLNTVLYEEGYAAIRRQDVLRIVPLSQAKRQSVPVRVGNEPAEIGESDRIITQIIPVAFAEAEALAENVRPLLSGEFAELSANELSNALIVTDTEANVRRLVEITRALDQSMSQARDVRVFHLQHADAQEAATLITETFRDSDRERDQQRGRRRWPGRGGGDDEDGGSGLDREVRAAADRRGNSVVVSATPAALELIAGVIEQIDRDSAAREAVLTYHARHATAEELQELFNTLFAERDDDRQRGQQPRRRGQRAPQQDQTDDGTAADLVGNVTAVADASTNTLLVLTAEANFPRIRQILEALDRPVPQVLVRVLIAELSHEQLDDVGFEVLRADTRIDNVVLRTLTGFGADDPDGLNFSIIHPDYEATLHALEQENVLDVLSRPYILTRDNQEANIFVGEDFPFIANTRITDTDAVINTIDHRDIGIILGVTPQINTEGLVVMDVSQELSAFQMSTIEITDGVFAPRFPTRTADTRVAVNTGQTVVIGGLMQDQLDERIRKVPILGDIPVIRHLFSRTERTRSKTELLLFLTPEVVMDPSELVEVSDRVRDEADHIQDTVEPGALERYLERMRVPGPTDAEPAPQEPAEQGLPGGPDDTSLTMDREALRRHLDRMLPEGEPAATQEGGEDGR